MLHFTQTTLAIPLILGVVMISSFLLRGRRAPTTGPLLPPLIILEAALTTDRFAFSKVVSCLRFLLRHGHALCAVRHEIVPDAPSIERLLVKCHEAFDAHPMGTAMLKRIFGYHHGEMCRAEYATMHDDFMKVIARDFVNEVAAVETLSRGDIGGKVSSLITFTEERELQQRWERVANIQLRSTRVAELDLESLLKGLSSCIAIPLLYGHDYLDRNPTVLEDWDTFASQAVAPLALGIPTWVPIKSFQQGIAARDRLHTSLTSVYRRIRQYHHGEVVDDNADMSDVSETALDRYKVFDRHAVPMDGIGRIELSLLWAQNKNTQQLLFWFIFYIYSVPGLLESLRQEVASSGAISTSSNEQYPQITALDISTLGKDCLLLKSAFLETFRLVEESVMFRQVTQNVTWDNGRHQHQFSAGSWLSISNCLTKHDPSLYPNPHEFVPERFIEESTATATAGPKTVSYKQLRPWGVGVSTCKGRTFAEKQLLAVAASIITLWDIEPASGAWKHPGFKAGATILAPRKTLRVCIKRRSFH